MAEGDKIPRKGGPGICNSDLLVINKIDLAPHVGADLDVMRRDSLKMRGERPFLMVSLRQSDRGRGGDQVGARAARITREDLLTPPEFRGLRLAESAAGRVGGARVELVRDRGETRDWGPATSRSRSASCRRSSSIGAGSPALPDQPHRRPAGRRRPSDRDHGARGHAGRRHRPVGHARPPGSGRFATQQWAVEVEDDACLVVLPGPTIPFRGCRYFQRGRVELAPRARLIWGDIWLAGRYDRGDLSERFQFERIVQDFEVRRAGRLVYRDRFRWDGPWLPEEANWYFGGHLASGSLFVAGPLPTDLPEPSPGVRRSVFRLESGDSCLRWCGHPTAVTADLVLTALSLAAFWTGPPGRLPGC